MENKRKRLGDLLIEERIINYEQLNEALKIQRETGQKLGEVLISSKMVNKLDIINVLKNKMGIEYIRPDVTNVDPKVAHLITEEVARTYEVIPINIKDDKLILAMSDPMNINAIDDISMLVGKEIVPAFAMDIEIKNAIIRFYGDQQAMQAAEEYKKTSIAAQAAAAAQKKAAKEEIEEVHDESPIVKMLNSMLEQSIIANASDIHIEPEKTFFRVRIRQDGQMVEIFRQDINVYPAFCSRVKVVCNMNIADKRKAQDGRVTYEVSGIPYELRVSTLPTVFGEKIVMRIINSTDLVKKKDKIFLNSRDQEKYEQILRNPYGIVLVTGPTGSGKSTTLYNAISELNRSSVNIITVEDPVEAVIGGIYQVHVDQKNGMTFASSLRAILRQDPDIVVVGEIRDQDTAEISLRAAATGHLVISTLHTNDASSTIMRLIDMGVDPFLIGISLVGVIAQRLVRTICTECKQPYTPSDFEYQMMGLEPSEEHQFFKGTGCRKCGGTGYKGRVAVFEILKVSNRIRGLINSGANSKEIKSAAIEEGMETLTTNCLNFALRGVTSVEEYLKLAAANEDDHSMGAKEDKGSKILDALLNLAKESDYGVDLSKLNDILSGKKLNISFSLNNSQSIDVSTNNAATQIEAPIVEPLYEPAIVQPVINEAASDIMKPAGNKAAAKPANKKTAAEAPKPAAKAPAIEENLPEHAIIEEPVFEEPQIEPLPKTEPVVADSEPVTDNVEQAIYASNEKKEEIAEADPLKEAPSSSPVLGGIDDQDFDEPVIPATLITPEPPVNEVPAVKNQEPLVSEPSEEKQEEHIAEAAVEKQEEPAPVVPEDIKPKQPMSETPKKQEPNKPDANPSVRSKKDEWRTLFDKPDKNKSN